MLDGRSSNALRFRGEGKPVVISGGGKVPYFEKLATQLGDLL